MDVFSLRDAVVDEYKKFATSFTTIFADDTSEQVEAIYAKERYWPYRTRLDPPPADPRVAHPARDKKAEGAS
jgi:hypothetical protein